MHQSPNIRQIPVSYTNPPALTPVL